MTNAGTTVWAKWTTYESRRPKVEEPWGAPKIEHGANTLRLREGEDARDVLARRGVTQIGGALHKREVVINRLERLP